MSIKKEYGMNLLTKKALWEYRKRKSKISIGDRIILYSTAPDSSLIGEFIVGEIITGNPDGVWERTKKDVCYSREEVVPYLKSGNYPIAFKIAEPKEYQQEIHISKIPFFKPPISYCRAPKQLLSLL